MWSPRFANSSLYPLLVEEYEALMSNFQGVSYTEAREMPVRLRKHFVRALKDRPLRGIRG